jgi:hypothetical protein
MIEESWSFENLSSDRTRPIQANYTEDRLTTQLIDQVQAVLRELKECTQGVCRLSMILSPP